MLIPAYASTVRRTQEKSKELERWREAKTFSFLFFSPMFRTMGEDTRSASLWVSFGLGFIPRIAYRVAYASKNVQCAGAESHAPAPYIVFVFLRLFSFLLHQRPNSKTHLKCLEMPPSDNTKRERARESTTKKTHQLNFFVGGFMLDEYFHIIKYRNKNDYQESHPHKLSEANIFAAKTRDVERALGHSTF